MMKCLLFKKNSKLAHIRFNSTIAIDVGASTSVVCVLEDGNPKVIENIEGERTTPAFIAFEEEDVVGITARRQALIHPKNTIYGFHGLVGAKYNEDLISKLKLNYKVAKGSDGSIVVLDESGKSRSVEEITSILLKRMKDTAENNLGKEVNSVIIGVPTYWKEEELSSLRAAAQMVNLKVDNFVLEPVSAVLAYGFGKGMGSKKVLVFDLGGRGLDVTLLDILGSSIQVKATARDETLGGETFDEYLCDYIQKEFQDKEKLDLSTNTLAQQKLKNASEVAKCELSTSITNEVNIPYIAANESGPKHLLVKISRSKLESIFEPLFNRSLEPIKTLLNEAGLTVGDIDDVVLVGGQSKTPRVAETIETFFGKPVFKPTAISADEAVALGLHLFQGEKIGSGEITKFTAVPLHIGVDVFGTMETMIPIGKELPIMAKRIFTTANDNQSDVDIKVRLLMGASKISSKNETLCRVSLNSLPNTLQRELQIEVVIKINEDGDITVAAREILTHSQPVTVTIKSFGGLSKDRVGAIIEETSKIDEVALLKDIAGRKDIFSEFCELERTIYSCRAILTEGDKSKLIKQLSACKLDLENGAGTLVDARNKLKLLNDTFSQSLHTSVKEDQKKLLNYE